MLRGGAGVPGEKRPCRAQGQPEVHQAVARAKPSGGEDAPIGPKPTFWRKTLRGASSMRDRERRAGEVDGGCPRAEIAGARWGMEGSGRSAIGGGL